MKLFLSAQFRACDHIVQRAPTGIENGYGEPRGPCAGHGPQRELRAQPWRQPQQQQFGAFPPQQRALSPYGAGAAHSRPASTNDLAGFVTQGPSNESIANAIRECLAEVDLDTVTKKQLKALAEQKLQCQLTGDRRTFLDSQIDFELANM